MLVPMDQAYKLRLSRVGPVSRNMERLLVSRFNGNMIAVTE